MRRWIRDRVLRFVRRLLAADGGRSILAESLPGRIPPGAAFQPAAELLDETPYPNVAAGIPSQRGEGAVFITGRFRSGSTLLWNIFRHIEGCTAYYEPLNERRWFDPQSRGEHVDHTHRGVGDYWREYDGLAELAAHYNEDWVRRELFMPAQAWDPDLNQFLDILIGRATGRPVLQFNRVDFRLPWLRAKYPDAKIVHLYRHPRDQWLSTLHGGPHFPLTGNICDFAPFDKFYLLSWGRDLAHAFPFLDARELDHPYELFYLIWKLSYLFGRHYADHSLAFEQLTTEPAQELQRLFQCLELNAPITDTLLGLIERPQLGRWTQYADANWFQRHESRCERTLAAFFQSTDDSRQFHYS
jgi:hypothetical protein